MSRSYQSSRSPTSEPPGPATARLGGAGRGNAFAQNQLGREGGPKPVAGAEEGLSAASVPLPFRSEMERAFQRDFGGLTVHAGPEATEANAALGSRAYALGEHVVLGEGAPDRALVAHELAHVVQQGGAGGPSAGEPSAGTDGPPATGSFEEEADQAAAAVLQGVPALVGQRAPVGVQRWSGKEHKRIGNRAYKAVAESSPELAALMGDSSEAVSLGKKKGKEERISYGESNRRSGDSAVTVEKLMAGEGAPGTEKHSRKGEAPHTVALARLEWRKQHKLALRVAAKSFKATSEKRKKALFDQAIRIESFGAHFLEDAFSAGHHTMKDMGWYAGGSTEAADKLGKGRYHNWFNKNGLHLAGSSGAEAFGDGHSEEAEESGYSKLVIEAVALSLRQVAEVATGIRKLGDRKAMIREVLALVPHIDAENFEETGADDEGWLEAAAIETMVAGYQSTYDRVKDDDHKKKTQSGLRVSGKDLTANETTRDLFDGEHDGMRGKKADRARIRRDLEFLGRALEPVWAGSGGARERRRFVGELLATLEVRISQFEDNKGAAPKWLGILKRRVGGSWKKAKKDLGKEREPFQEEVEAMVATIPEASSGADTQT